MRTGRFWKGDNLDLLSIRSWLAVRRDSEIGFFAALRERYDPLSQADSRNLNTLVKLLSVVRRCCLRA